MAYCPDCGGPLTWTVSEGRRRRWCPRCRKIVYRRLKVGAGCIIEEGDEILLVERANAPFRHSWGLPAGYVEYDESPAEAAARETREETGLRVEVGALAGVYFFTDDPRGNGILIVYRCFPVGGEVRLAAETAQIARFRREAVPEALAGGGHDQAIRAWIDRSALSDGERRMEKPDGGTAAMSAWTRQFYARQVEWGDVYRDEVAERHRRKAAWVGEVIGAPPRRVLELGAGGGQDAVALAEMGYEVVAVEQEPLLTQHIRALLRRHPRARVQVIEADFYRVELAEGAFDAVCYWDGFGIGTDDEQRLLLRRIRAWLRPGGASLIEVYTPWHAAKAAGHRWRVGRATREYAFDGEGCRWIDRWWVTSPEEAVEQSLRCYSPADLRLLLEGTGLKLVAVRAGGMVDYESRRYVESAALGQAMSYVALLRPVVEG